MSRLTRVARNPRAWLIVYVVVLLGIAFWPSHVDEGAGPVVRLITRLLPWLTYSRMEFGANILLFVPFGALLALALHHRYLVLPIALVATVVIESVQSLFDGRRTPSIMDLVANATGAAVGLILIAFIDWLRSVRRVEEA